MNRTSNSTHETVEIGAYDSNEDLSAWHVSKAKRRPQSANLITNQMQQCRLLTQDEAEARRRAIHETKAVKRIRIQWIPILLLLAFVASACFYAYARFAYGMTGAWLQARARQRASLACTSHASQAWARSSRTRLFCWSSR